MNTLFWIIIALMILAAVLLVVLPLFKKHPLTNVDGEQRNIGIARQRLAELKQQLQEGSLSEEQFDEQYLELQQSLNDDIDVDTTPQRQPGSGRWAIPVLVLLVPTLSILVYLLLGDTNALIKAEQQKADIQAAVDVQAQIAPLIERLKQNPNDDQSRLMLGRSYIFLQQFQNAVAVYAELYRRQPDNAEIMLNYADTLASTRNGRLAGEPAELIFKALKLAPDNNDALWLAGMAKVEEGDSAQAIAYWQQLISRLPAESDALPMIKEMIAELAGRQVEQSPVASATNINVHVVLDSALKGQVQAAQTVFIYAQALNGPKMPLAITRKTASELPVSVTLNDAMAMQPGMHLADFKQLKIIARVSKTGNASTQTGDLIGSAEISLPVSDQAVEIVINQEVK